MLIAPRLLPRTRQLCMHCRQSPAGFWVTPGRPFTRPVRSLPDLSR